MSKLVLFVAACCSLAMLVGARDAPTAPAPAPDGREPAFDVDRPETWARSIRREKDILASMGRELIQFATDKERSDDDRIEAIMVLGRIQCPDSTRFLLENIALRLNPSHIRGDLQMAQRWPCSAGISFSRDWNYLPSILRELNKKKTEWELLLHGSDIQSILSKNRERAKALVHDGLGGDKDSPLYKKNLAFLKTRALPAEWWEEQ